MERELKTGYYETKDLDKNRDRTTKNINIKMTSKMFVKATVLKEPALEVVRKNSTYPKIFS